MKLSRIATLLTFLLGLTFAVQAQAPAPATAPDTSKNSSSHPKMDKSASDSKKTAAKADSTLIDINTASEADLKSIKGIGDVYAAKIVKGRPYKNKTQLVSRGIVPEATYAKIKDQVIASK